MFVKTRISAWDMRLVVLPGVSYHKRNVSGHSWQVNEMVATYRMSHRKAKTINRYTVKKTRHTHIYIYIYVCVCVCLYNSFYHKKWHFHTPYILERDDFLENIHADIFGEILNLTLINEIPIILRRHG